MFEQKYDFWAALFEYLIKDYNKDNGGKYAEYAHPARGGDHHGRHRRCRPTSAAR
ncbi:MAG: hypothetical protein U1F20_04695 [Lysobacterales bacterium]